jgi:signal transduction histidine kinase
MTVILGQAERLSDDGADAEPVELIETRAEEIVDRIEQVRRITGSPGDDDAPPVQVDLAEVVLRAVERERERHPAASIDVTVAAEPTVRADGDLSLAVENLIQNGIEHADAESPTVEMHVGRQDDEGVLRIVDGGPGIPEDQQAALLQWDNDGGLVKGPGVGLAVVRVLLDRYEGTIDFRPVEPTGTEAVVALPLGD